MSTALLSVVILGLCVAAVAVEMLSDAAQQPATDAADSRSGWDPWRSHTLRAWAAIRRAVRRMWAVAAHGATVFPQRIARLALAVGGGARRAGAAMDRGTRRAAETMDRGVRRAGAAFERRANATQRATASAVLGMVASAGSAAGVGRRRAHAATTDMSNRRAARRLRRADERAGRRATALEERVRRREAQAARIRGQSSTTEHGNRAGPIESATTSDAHEPHASSTPVGSQVHARIPLAGSDDRTAGATPAIARTLRRTPAVGDNGNGRRAPVVVDAARHTDGHARAAIYPGDGPWHAAARRPRDGVSVPLRIPWTKRLQAGVLLLLLSAFLSVALVVVVVAVVLAIASALAGL